LRRNVLIVVQDSSLTEQGGEAGRIVYFFGDGFMLAIADIDQSVCDPEHLLPIRRSLDQDDEIDVAMSRHGPPGSGSDEYNANQVAAAFRAYIFHSDGEGIVVPGRNDRRRHLGRFRKIEQLRIQLLRRRNGRGRLR
jgi:hypothetical protein